MTPGPDTELPLLETVSVQFPARLYGPPVHPLDVELDELPQLIVTAARKTRPRSNERKINLRDIRCSFRDGLELWHDLLHTRHYGFDSSRFGSCGDSSIWTRSRGNKLICCDKSGKCLYRKYRHRRVLQHPQHCAPTDIYNNRTQTADLPAQKASTPCKMLRAMLVHPKVHVLDARCPHS